MSFFWFISFFAAMQTTVVLCIRKQILIQRFLIPRWTCTCRDLFSMNKNQTYCQKSKSSIFYSLTSPTLFASYIRSTCTIEGFIMNSTNKFIVKNQYILQIFHRLHTFNDFYRRISTCRPINIFRFLHYPRRWRWVHRW